MSMRRILTVITAVCGLMLQWGCDKPQTEEPKEDWKEDFALAVSDVTAVSCHFAVTPKDEQMPYVVMLVEKSDFDSYEDEYKYRITIWSGFSRRLWRRARIWTHG